MYERSVLTKVTGPDEALDIVRAEFQLGLQDPRMARPFLAVALHRGPALESLNELAADLPCVVVGVTDGEFTEPPERFDILLSSKTGVPSPWVYCRDVAATLSLLVDSVVSSPAAAVSLVQLLRLGESMSVRNAIVAESFVYSMLQAGPRFHEWLSTRADRRPSQAEPDPVLVKRIGTHLEITLNRPEARNALNAAMRDALLTAFHIVLYEDSIRSVRLSGNGPTFCSGGDLNEFGTAGDPVFAHSVRVNLSVGALLTRCADRVVVDVHGACVGAGIEIPAFSDRITATPDSVFVLPEVGFGLVPGAGGTASIPRRIGRQRTAYMAISGAVITAATAIEWQLIDELRDA